MRIYVMILFLGFAITFGLIPRLEKARPMYWKVFAVLFIAISAIFTIMPPLAGNFPDARFVSSIENKNIIDLSIVIEENSLNFNESRNAYYGKAYYPEHVFEKDYQKVLYDVKFEDSLKSKLVFNKEMVVKAFYIPEASLYKVVDLVEIEPTFVYPYVPALMQRIRNLNFHVPMAWISIIAFAISMIFAVQYLRKRDILYDIKSQSAAFIGLIFAIMATVTGMVWAKFNWGSFWNNDPRQVTILAQIIIYFAYFSLRSSTEEESKRARLSAVYSIFAFSSVPFLMIIIPRLFASLHPGAKDDGTTGPVVDPQSGMLDSALALSFYFAISAFIIIFFWLLSLNVRYRILKRKVENLNA